MYAFLLSTIVLLFGCCDNFEIQPRIINGYKATPYQFPSYVYYHTVPLGNENARCAGVLISDRWILTAGHCLLKTRKDIDVYLGYLPDGNYTGKVRVNTLNQHIYPLADMNGAYDLGLIKLPGAIKSSTTIEPIRLPKECNNDHLYDEVIIFPGTGYTSFDQTQSRDKTLKYAICTTFDRDASEKFVRNAAELESTLFSFSRNGQSTYKGDSGGAAMRKRDNTLIGIASHVLPNVSLRGKPIVVQGITKLQYFFDWISEKTGLDLPKCSEN